MKPPAVLALLLTVLLCAGCGERAASRADLVLINGAEIGTIDPAQSSAQTEARVINSLFEGLMRFNASGRAEPGCALEPEISADQRVWTFTIRDDARWSNGAPVTATDFVRSWKRFLEPATAAEYSAIFFTIAGTAEYNAGTLTDFSRVGIKALSDRKLELTLVNPVPYFRDCMAFMSFCPVHMDTLESLGPDQAHRYWKPDTIVTNGPYLLREWRLNDRIRLEKNPLYWDAANVRMATVDVLPIDNANTAMNLFLTGGADLMMDKGLIPNSIADELRKKSYFHYEPFLGTSFIRFNTTRKPYDDPRVRKALTMTIDRRRIVEVVTRMGEKPISSVSPPGIGYGYQVPEGLPQDIQEARRLLAEAGYPDGRGFPVLNYLYPSKFPTDNGMAVELQAMWKQALGITVALQRQEYKVYLATQRQVDYDLSRSSWVGDYNDPNTFLDVFTSTNGNNRTGWKNARYDSLIAAAAAEPDAGRRYQLLQQAEHLLLTEECVVAPCYQYVGVQFYHPDKLGGIEANLIDEHPLRTLYWK